MKKTRLYIMILSALVCMTFAGCEKARADDPDVIEIVETEEETNEYTVMFNLNGGTLISGQLQQTVEEGGAAVAPVAENGTKKLSWDTDFSNITEMTFVNAVWTEEETNEYPVMFNLNGGTLISGQLQQTVEEGGAAVAPVVENGTKKLSWDTDFSNITGMTFVNAVWTADAYTVTFDPAVDGLAPVRVSVEEGTAARAPEVEAEGLKFCGWDRDFSRVTGDMTVTARWEKEVMNSVEIADYAETRVATVYAHDVFGNNSSGSGFFIDNNGTFVTNYHVIEFANSLSIEFSGGGSYNVSRIITFSEKYDLAVLQVDISGNDYFELSRDIAKGEQVYAIGSALGYLSGSITGGIISSTSRMLGAIDCIQMDASISGGNSGGPLVNTNGEVIGVNAFSFTNGTNLNLAINVKMLDQLPDDMNYTISDYIEWWNTEIDRSYRPKLLNNPGDATYSLVHTYQNVTGDDCAVSFDSADDGEYYTVGDYTEGYNSEYEYYIYEYNSENYDDYVVYLKGLGFTYDADNSGVYYDGRISYYTSVTSETEIMLCITSENCELGMECLVIAIRV